MTNKSEQCPFCHLPPSSVLYESELSLAFLDKSPVTNGHTLIIPKNHKKDWFELTDDEVISINALIHRRKKDLLNMDPQISGFNIGMNCGISGGQTVFHCHVHLIPRREGDAANPRGGVRGVIPSKQSY